MIRQAISCDMCGAEKKQTNHWFVAYAHAGELRVAGWHASGRMRAGAKHLCGQTCVHKLVDEFIAGIGSSRPPVALTAQESGEAKTDTSLATRCTAPSSIEISDLPVYPLRVVPAAVIALAPSRPVDDPRGAAPGATLDDPPNYASRRRRSEAWERERERCASQTSRRKTS